MKEIETSFAKVVSLTAEEAEPLEVGDGEEEGVRGEILSHSLVGKLLSTVGNVEIKDVSAAAATQTSHSLVEKKQSASGDHFVAQSEAADKTIFGDDFDVIVKLGVGSRLFIKNKGDTVLNKKVRR